MTKYIQDCVQPKQNGLHIIVNVIHEDTTATNPIDQQNLH